MDLENQASTDTATSRRTFLRNAGIAGGVAWAAPQIINTTPAFAVASDPDCITFDDFTVEQLVEDSSGSPGPTSSTVSGQPTSSIIGGERTVSVEAFGGNAGLSAAIHITSEVVSFETVNNQTARAIISYTNGPFDLSSVNRVTLEIDVAESDPDDDITVALSLGGVEIAKTVPPSPTQLVWNIADFGTDPATVSTIALRIDSNTNMVIAADATGECFWACP